MVDESRKKHFVFGNNGAFSRGEETEIEHHQPEIDLKRVEEMNSPVIQDQVEHNAMNVENTDTMKELIRQFQIKKRAYYNSEEKYRPIYKKAYHEAMRRLNEHIEKEMEIEGIKVGH